jgi:glutathione peroxidase
MVNGHLYEFVMKGLDGTDVPLRTFKDKVLFIVNVASKCGYTYQYDALQTLYERYQSRGFEILGFPANDFFWQEPGTDQEIRSFCSTIYGVTFPLSSKISVKGKNIDPLYAYLTSKESNPRFGGRITWNFNKFLLGRDGEILDRFDTKIEPLDPRVIAAVESALGG